MGIGCEARLGLTANDGRRRGVFFDRDGVLNESVVRDRKPYPPATVADVRLIDAAREAVSALHDAGFVTICVTNQPDVARGKLDRDVAESINAYVIRELGLDDLVACFHDDADACSCRKPKPGMILEAASRHAIDVARSYLVGDRWKDIDAGVAAGCRTILVDHAWDERDASREPDARVGTALEAARWILEDVRNRT